MAITIKGVRLKKLEINVDANGNTEIQGNYELMSSTGVVLAKQGFNGYHDIKVKISPALMGSIETLTHGLKQELNQTLGLEE